MASRYNIDLSRPGPGVAWGFRLHGGSEYGSPLSIQRVFSGSPADGNLQRGDVILSVNGSDVKNLTLVQTQEMIKSAGNRLSLFVQRENLPPVQDPQVSPPAPSFAPSSYNDSFHSPPQQRQQQPVRQTQQFHPSPVPTHSTLTSQLSPGAAAVSSVKYQPTVDSQHHPQQHFQQPQQNFQHNYHHPEPAPSQAAWQPANQEEGYQEQGGDVDDEHLRPVKEIKSMFNHSGSPCEGPNIVRKGHPVKVNQPKKTGTPVSSKYQPPSPSIKPAAPAHVQSLRQPPVYQQRSSYNPLDFQGVTSIPKSSIPPNRPPGLIQRGAIDTKPAGTSLDYQKSIQFHHIPSDPTPHHHPAAPTSANLDQMNDFYLHGLNAKGGLPDFSKPSAAPYSGKVLPPRSEMAIRTPTGAKIKKEFKADQSAVYRILQEEEEATKQGGRGGHGRGEQGRGEGRREAEDAGKAYQLPGSGGQSRLAELLEKDQAQLARYHDEVQQQEEQHFHQPQQQHYHQQQQQQHYQHQQQHQSSYQHSPQQPTKHLVTSTAQLIQSPSREHPPRHEDGDQYSGGGGYHQPQSYQQSWNRVEHERPLVGHSGLPETDF